MLPVREREREREEGEREGGRGGRVSVGPANHDSFILIHNLGQGRKEGREEGRKEGNKGGSREREREEREERVMGWEVSAQMAAKSTEISDVVEAAGAAALKVPWEIQVRPPSFYLTSLTHQACS